MRRYDQIGLGGHPSTKPTPPPEEVIRDLRARDERDRNRADSPLKPAPDAFLLDSTNLTLEEAVKAAEETVNSWLAKSEFSDSRR
jgi:cytidylate kinase